MPKIPQDFKVLHMSNIGRVYTVIVRGEPDAVVKGDYRMAKTVRR